MHTTCVWGNWFGAAADKTENRFVQKRAKKKPTSLMPTRDDVHFLFFPLSVGFCGKNEKLFRFCVTPLASRNSSFNDNNLTCTANNFAQLLGFFFFFSQYEESGVKKRIIRHYQFTRSEIIYFILFLKNYNKKRWYLK